MIQARHLFGFACILLSVAIGRDSFEAWIAQTELPPLATETGVEVRDRNGELLRAYQVEDGRWRPPSSLASTDPRFVKMLVRYEDKRFYEHGGVDLVAMLRAVGQALRHGEIVSGGSTLTMQVARLLEDSGTGAWRGKLRQMRVAWALEQELSKTQILDLYLQRAPYGGNIEGVSAASQAYFGKPSRRLTQAEAALLVALPQSPELRRPDRHPEIAKRARDRVLHRLADAGVIVAEALTPALSAPVPELRQDFPKLAPHLADRLNTGELTRIDTTIDASIQRQIEALARRSLSGLPDRLSVAILIADHQTGEIISSVGSATYSNSRNAGFVDMTQAIRSPGSTLKPLVYGLAFDRGLAHPETLISDRPRQFGNYAPQNFDGAFRGDVSVREALQMSLNLPVVSLVEVIGPSVLVDRMKQAGMSPTIPGGKPGLAVSLGGAGVTLEDLVTLYAGVASGGTVKQLSAVASTADDQGRFLSERSTWYLSDILRDVSPLANGRAGQIAFKTGTSYGHRDAWAVGYDGKNVVGVWIGRPDGTSVPGAFGGDLAAPVLFEAFGHLGDLTPLPAPPRDALIVSRSSLPSPLKTFREKGQSIEGKRPTMAFPPDGSKVQTDGPLVARIRDGQAPFTWLADGVPVTLRSYDREQEFTFSGRGYMTITVIDASGQSARTSVFLN